MCLKSTEIGWFEDEKEILAPAIKEKNSVYSQMNAAVGEKKEKLNILYKELKGSVRDKIATPKLNFRRKQAHLIHQMCKFPAQAWEASFRLAK